MRAMDNSTAPAHLAEKDLDSSLQSDMESQQTTVMDGSTTLNQIPEKTSDSPHSDADSSEEEYPAAFKLAMIVVALVLGMFLVSQNKI
jgi:hypothetical protein